EVLGDARDDAGQGDAQEADEVELRTHHEEQQQRRDERRLVVRLDAQDQSHDPVRGVRGHEGDEGRGEEVEWSVGELAEEGEDERDDGDADEAEQYEFVHGDQPGHVVEPALHVNNSPSRSGENSTRPDESIRTYENVNSWARRPGSAKNSAVDSPSASSAVGASAH